MDFKIEKGIPLPPLARRRSRYPFDEMAVGDSFLVPEDLRSRVRGALTTYARERDLHGAFTMRTLPDGGCRVWRVALEGQPSPAVLELREWLGARAVVKKGSREAAAALFEDWRAWSEERGRHPGKINAFSHDLAKLGYRRWRDGRGRGFEGIKLAQSAEAPR